MIPLWIYPCGKPKHPTEKTEKYYEKIPPYFILPSAAITISRNQIRFQTQIDKNPEMGDLVCGSISYLGQYSTIENKEGRIHIINDGSKAIFVFGNRYAPDYYEGVVPDEFTTKVDLIARSGLSGA